MQRLTCLRLFCLMFSVGFGIQGVASAQQSAEKSETVFIWPDLAPGETSRATGTTLPFREQDNPPIERVDKIRLPTMDVYPATGKPNGASVVILPGGGFGRVVPNLEGSEAAHWMNELGVTCFVLRYRTNEARDEGEPSWKRPLQDGQRAIRWVRSNAAKWKLDPKKVGLLAFSAGGQVGAMLISADQAAYKELDGVDQLNYRPNFAMLVYPWRCYDSATDSLLPQISVDTQTPPTFIVHTHDDRSTSLGAVLIYAALKKKNIAAELHVYENGGHGYGTRNRPNSNIGTWKDRATDWLARRF